MKHKHNWQFKEEVSYPIKVIEPKLIEKFLAIYNPIIVQPFVLYEYYNKFVCECGEEKEVEIK